MRLRTMPQHRCKGEKTGATVRIIVCNAVDSRQEVEICVCILVFWEPSLSGKIRQARRPSISGELAVFSTLANHAGFTPTVVERRTGHKLKDSISVTALFQDSWISTAFESWPLYGWTKMMVIECGGRVYRKRRKGYIYTLV
jgi:hypothetical protein